MLTSAGVIGGSAVAGRTGKGAGKVRFETV
jgi:hypothetical protein